MDGTVIIVLAFIAAFAVAVIFAVLRLRVLRSLDASVSTTGVKFKLAGAPSKDDGPTVLALARELGEVSTEVQQLKEDRAADRVHIETANVRIEALEQSGKASSLRIVQLETQLAETLVELSREKLRADRSDARVLELESEVHLLRAELEDAKAV